MITQIELKELLDYDPNTGIFTWKINKNKIKFGKIAGSKLNGYVSIQINKKHYYAHRLAWLYIHGKWPDDQIDHRNGNRSDNSIHNLRECTHAQNNQNKKNVRGYIFVKQLQKWKAYISVNNKQKILGYFETESQARQAYEDAKLKYHTFNPIL